MKFYIFYAVYDLLLYCLFSYLDSILFYVLYLFFWRNGELFFFALHLVVRTCRLASIALSVFFCFITKYWLIFRNYLESLSFCCLQFAFAASTICSQRLLASGLYYFLRFKGIRKSCCLATWDNLCFS